MDLSPPLSLPLVKLTRPRQSRVLPRPAMFEALDAAMAEHRLIWVSAPGGMGKTTLVSSYLTDRALEGTWYQIDASDSDPATLFYYLAEAVKLERGGKVRLPLYIREHEPDAIGFARRFFRTLFGSVAPGWTLVFDNYHEVDASSPLHRVLAVAVEEAPPAVNVFVTSRGAPPPPFAKAIASGLVYELGQDRLVFDAGDTQALFRLHASQLDAQQAHTLCRGWPAGLVLLLAGKGSTTGPELEFAPDLQYVFDYFAEEVLRRADDVTRDFLIATAFLPTITAPVAGALSGREDAAQLLEKLYRQNFFVDKRPGRAPAYQYHDLFREFLVRRATESRSVGELEALKRASAQALHDAGQIEAALDLYLQSAEVGRAEDIVRGEAKQLIAQGRLDTISRWLSMLPQARVQASDELCYLRGLTTLKNDAVKARNDFERAHEGFSTSGNIAGQLLAASGVIETYFVESGNFLAAHRWLRIIEQCLEPGAHLLTAEDQLRVYTSVLAACLREPSPTLGALARDRVLELLDADLDPNLRVRAGSALQTYLTQTGDFHRIETVATLLEPALRRAEVSPVNRALWLARYAFNLLHIQEFDRAIALLDEVIALVAAYDLTFLDSLARGFRIWAALFCGDFADAQRRIDD